MGVNLAGRFEFHPRFANENLPRAPTHAPAQPPELDLQAQGRAREFRQENPRVNLQWQVEPNWERVRETRCDPNPKRTSRPRRHCRPKGLVRGRSLSKKGTQP